MWKTTKVDLANKLKSNCDEMQVLAVSHDNHLAYKFDTFNDLGLIVMQRIQSLLTSNLGVASASVTLVFDRYDCEISIK